MATERSRKFTLQWHVTERCNCRCAHCYQGDTPSPELSFDGLLEIIEQYKELLSLLQVSHGHINLTGGEPFIREDIWDLLNELRENRGLFSYAVLSNGTMVDEEIARRLKRFAPSHVQVSIEGSEPTHDSIRGSGSYQKAVSGIQCLVRQGISVSISFTAHQDNYREFPMVAALGKSLRVTQVWSDRLIPCGRGMSLSPLDQDQTREFFTIMLKEKRRAERSPFNRTRVSMGRALQFLVAGGQPYRCSAGERLLAVQANGDLLPCRRMPVILGNLGEHRLSELYNTELLVKLRDPANTCRECVSCPLACNCRGGLKCLSYAIFNDPFARDPGCWTKLNRTAVE